jgi:hypothetical protein
MSELACEGLDAVGVLPLSAGVSDEGVAADGCESDAEPVSVAAGSELVFDPFAVVDLDLAPEPVLPGMLCDVE